MFGGGLAMIATTHTPPAGLAGATAADWITPKREVEAWLKDAKPGARLLYGQGERLIRGETAAFLRHAQAAGEVALFQPRSALAGRFDFLAVKRLVVRDKKAGGRTADPAMRVIFKRLVRAAERGERAPSDGMLAALAGLSSPAKAQWRVRKLTVAGLIAVRLERGLDGVPFRVVTIADSGAATAATESAR